METEKYIDKVTESEDRYDLYMELFLYKKAAETAIKIKDSARLQEVNKFLVLNLALIFSSDYSNDF